MKNLAFCFALITVLQFPAFTQDEVLLTIDKQPVMKSEFERIYRKNNHVEGYEGKKAEEYLDMFINFKLKVYEAEKLGYDTLASFRNELAGYRDQLSKPYLQDRKLIDQLVQEAYYRMVNEVNASHIMIKLVSDATPADTLAAYNKAMAIRNRILAGESFEKLAREVSDDPSGKINEGKLGWFSAFSMVYPFENAAYQAKPNELSMPVRSKFGYHVIRVNGTRTALGEIKLAHIMIRSERNDIPELKVKAREKADNCYKLLQQGTQFEAAVKQYSEDAGTARNNGVMRWLRSGELPPSIEDAVFALSDSGDFTVPVESDYGWHIFQLIGKRPVASFENMKTQLEERIMMDERGKQTEAKFIIGLKEELGYKTYPENIAMISGIMDSTVYSGMWDTVMDGTLIEPVFTIRDRDYSQKELVDFIRLTKRYNKKDTYSAIVNRKLNELSGIELKNQEKDLLEEKFPAFKYLMEEYHDGILLFNIMDNLVWSRAVNDTLGLKTFFNQNTSNYWWPERADISVYTFKETELFKTVLKAARKRAKVQVSEAEFQQMVCPDDSIPCVEITDQLVEKGETIPPGDFNWERGFAKKQSGDNTNSLLLVNDLIPPMPKSFGEVQGQVTADYQNLLDKQWIEELRAKYKVEIHQEVLQQIK